MTPKQNSCRSFLLVGMPDRAMKILCHGSLKDRSITFNLAEKNCNNILRQRSTLLVNTIRLLKRRQYSSIHGTKIAKMVLLLFLLSEMVLCTLMLYRRHFHCIANQNLYIYIHLRHKLIDHLFQKTILIFLL
jgi:hypothetical protein